LLWLLILPLGVPVLKFFGVVLPLLVEQALRVSQSALGVEHAVGLAGKVERLAVRLVTEFYRDFDVVFASPSGALIQMVIGLFPRFAQA
jgi:hypothetical protein